MNGDPLPNTASVSRYCKPSSVQDGVILPNAFMFRDSDTYLSINWLEYLEAPDLESAIDMVRETFCRKNFSIRHRGRFVVLNVGDVRRAIRAVIKKTPRVEHLPMDDDPSHSGISGYSATELATSQAECACDDGDDSSRDYTAIEVATAGRIANLVNSSSIYAAVIEREGIDRSSPH